MWDAFNAEQLMMKVGELEHVRKRLKMQSKRMLGFAASGTLTCCVQRHHMINTVEIQKVIRAILECTEVPKALRRHMYDQIRIVQRKRQTGEGNLRHNQGLQQKHSTTQNQNVHAAQQAVSFKG